MPRLALRAFIPPARRRSGSSFRASGWLCSVGVCTAAVLAAASASPAAIISDRSFFDSVPHTLFDFETDGSGAPVILGEGFVRPMPANAYASLGVTVSNGARWANDGGALFDTAQAIGGSLDNSISTSASRLEFAFTVPVRAFGLWMINNRTLDGAGPEMRAFNAQNELVASVRFQSDGPMVDGTLSNALSTVDYGFVGMASQTLISRVEITTLAAAFDDMFISPVPSPGAIALLGLAGLAMRRRRS